jgi:hypothetical protein
MYYHNHILRAQPFGFNPLSLNPKLWLDATDLAALTLSGTDVAAMLDKSGNGYDFTQAAPANRPVVDSAITPTKVIFAAANSEFLDGSAHLPNFLTDGNGEFVVVNTTAVSSTFISIGNAVNTNYLFRTMTNNTGKALLVTQTTTTLIAATDSLITATAVRNYISRASNNEVWQDNINKTTSDTTNGFWLDEIAIGAPDGFRISSRYDPTPSYYNSSLSELLYFPEPLSVSDRTELYNYLVLKHGV